MKVLVAVKRVADPNVKARVNAEGTAIDLANIKMSMNPFDEIAVEAAVRLKEQGCVDEVVAVSCGTIQSQETLRTALAMGADRAVLIESTVELQPLAVAKLLSALATQERPDLIILGKQAIDDDSNQTGQMVSAMLDWPQATFASAVSVAEGVATVAREVDNGTETLELTLPAVVTTDLRLNTPRYVTLPSLMKAKKKTIEITTPEALKVDVTPRVVTIKIEEPSQSRRGELLGDASALVAKVRSEQKVFFARAK
ncbi:electron transfer flavoprotein subunit beta/FixA family protein [Caballeronia sp. DA-9]|uniref:electron transfer flavoprotein subunit beta/FixA family protein n=1 Tax=Caballeronia sp. DA-9 TaxID=3436237 RepID=UPI003F6811A4